MELLGRFIKHLFSCTKSLVHLLSIIDKEWGKLSARVTLIIVTRIQLEATIQPNQSNDDL